MKRELRKCNTFTCVIQASVSVLTLVSVQGEPEVSKDQFCISWWLSISNASHFMAGPFHFVATRMTANVTSGDLLAVLH